MLARQNFSPACEGGLNAQIGLELQAAHEYLAMAAYCGRDGVALPGFFRFFMQSSEEERQHASKLIDYVNKRGGTVKLGEIRAAVFDSVRKCVETALCMEKQVSDSLPHLHGLAEEAKDPSLTDLAEDLLEEQISSIKEISDIMTMMDRTGDGLGLYTVDRDLEKK